MTGMTMKLAVAGLALLVGGGGGAGPMRDRQCRGREGLSGGRSSC